jgi:glutamate-1-semialdehyde 2,1-aminomutase
MPLFLFDEDPDLRMGFYWCSEMLKRGIYVHPWHNMFLSAAMTDADIDAALDAAGDALRALKTKRSILQPSKKLQALFAPRAAPAAVTS